MDLKFAGVRWATKTNGSARVTIPIDVVKSMWKEEIRDLPVCIIKEDDKILLDLPENVMNKGFLSPEDEKRLMDEYLKYRRAQVGNLYIKTVESMARLYYEKEKFDREKRIFLNKLEKMLEKNAGIFKERELHFISAGRVAECMASIFLDLQELEEENISSLLEEIKQMKGELNSINSSLKELDLAISRGQVSEKDVKEVKGVLEYRSKILKERWEKIRKVIEGRRFLNAELRFIKTMTGNRDRCAVNPFVLPSEVAIHYFLMIIASLSPMLLFTIPNLFLAQNLLWATAASLLLVGFIYLTFRFYKAYVVKKLKGYGKYNLEANYPEMASFIQELCKKVGVRVPALLFAKEAGLNAVVFGFRNEKYLMVSEELCKRLETSRKLVETVLLHELSHIKNKDVVQYEMAEAMWKSFAILALINAIFISALSASFIGFQGFHAAIYVAVVFYILPLLIVYYLNYAIGFWREVRADLRTITYVGNKPLLDLLSLYAIFSGKSSWRYSITRFFHSIEDRLSLAKGELRFKELIKKIFLGAAISETMKWFTGWLLHLFIFPLYFNPLQLIYYLIAVGIILSFLPSHLIYHFRRLKGKRRFLWMIGISLAISLIYSMFVVAFNLLLPLLIGLISPEVFSSLINFLFLQPCYLLALLAIIPLITFPLIFSFQLMVHFLYDYYRIDEKVRGKILMPCLILWILIIGVIIQRNVLQGLFLLLLSLIFMKSAKLFLSKCPFCRGRVTDRSHLPTCNKCSALLNKEFFIYLS